MSAKVIVKIIFLAVISVLALVILIAGKIVPLKKYKNEALRLRQVVKIRMICFIVMLSLLLLVVLIK